MCNLTQNQIDIVKAKATEFLMQSKAFTSVHLANAIKMDGTWMRNTDVADWLRNSMGSLVSSLSLNYTATLISVNGGKDRAYLYHPVSFDVNSFTDTNISAMTPDEFQRLHGVDPLTGTKVAQPAQATTTIKKSSKKIVLLNAVSADKSDRFYIPAKIARAIGLRPHQKVTDKKFAIKNIPATLRVHADGRISIPRSCTTVKKGAVKIFIKDGFIGFEKA